MARWRWCATGAAFAAAGWDRRALLLVPVLLAINWFGDSLDGTLARVRQHQRPRYGYYVDHVVDLADLGALFGGLALSGSCSPSAIAGAAGHVLHGVAESYLATHTVGSSDSRSRAWGPRNCGFCWRSARWSRPCGPTVVGRRPDALFDVGAVVAVAGMAIVFVLSACRNARALYLAEPIPGTCPMIRRAGALAGSRSSGQPASACSLLPPGALLECEVHYLFATALAVEGAILHNFIWHCALDVARSARRTPPTGGLASSASTD